MSDPFRTEQNRLPEPANEFRGITNKDGVGARAFASIAKLWQPRGTTAESPASTVSRFSMRLIDRLTGKAYSADEVARTLPTGITGASAVTNIVTISQTDYDALASTDPATVYLITA